MAFMYKASYSDLKLKKGIWVGDSWEVFRIHVKIK